MTSPEFPPVIAALDVTSSEQASRLMHTLDRYDREDVALQFRASRLMAEGDALIREAQALDWKVVAATRYGDEPKKLALDLDTFREGKNPKPFAITMEPTAPNREDAHLLVAALAQVHDIGVVTIGFGRSDRIVSTDHDHIADIDFASWQRSSELGIHAAEVTFSGLHHFYEAVATHEEPASSPHVIVSKILDNDPSVIQANALQAYEYGARSILLGGSIIRANDPTVIVDAVLEAHHQATE